MKISKGTTPGGSERIESFHLREVRLNMLHMSEEAEVPPTAELLLFRKQFQISVERPIPGSYAHIVGDWEF
jgi:hypothetical protein